MDIQTSTVLGEIRFEFKDDGSGELLHVVRTDKTFVRDGDTGKLLSPPKLEAVAISQADLDAIVAGNYATVAAQVAALSVDLTAANKAGADKDARIAELEAQIATLSAAPPSGTVTNSQARDALGQAGKLSAVLAYMHTLPETDRVWIYWEYSPTFNRAHPLIAEMAQRLSLTGEEVDALFALAATL